MKCALSGLLILVAVLCGCDCSGGGSGPNQKTPQQMVNEGWQSYAAKNYSSALSSFQGAITADPTLVDAYNGAGWAYGKIGDLASASARFAAGMSRDSVNIQMRAGVGFVANGQRDYALSILRAGQVLAADSSWIFGRDLSITAADIHLLLAEDYFATGDFAASLAELRKLEPAFVVNTSSDLGRMALAAEIERLRPLV